MSNLFFPIPKNQDKKNETDDDLTGNLEVNEVMVILKSTLRKEALKDEKIISFIDSFVRCKNIPQASRDAGVHKNIGHKWRHRADIASAIEKLTVKSYVKFGFDASEVVERTKEIVDFDPLDLVNPDGSYKSNLNDIAPEARRVLKKLKVKNIYKNSKDHNGIKSKIIVGEVIEYEFYDKLKGIELLGAEKDLFKKTTRVEHDVTKDMADILLASARRAEDENKKLGFEEGIEVEYEEVNNEE